MNWKSSKFVHALGVQIVSAIALFTGHLSGEGWIAASTLALGIHAAGNIMAQKVAQGDSP